MTPPRHLILIRLLRLFLAQATVDEAFIRRRVRMVALTGSMLHKRKIVSEEMGKGWKEDEGMRKGLAEALRACKKASPN